jgi:hypothetical protein
MRDYTLHPAIDECYATPKCREPGCAEDNYQCGQPRRAALSMRHQISTHVTGTVSRYGTLTQLPAVCRCA